MATGHTLDANTVVLWRLDDGPNAINVADAAGNATLNTITGNVWSTPPGLIGLCRVLDGSNYVKSGVATSSALALTLSSGSWTVEAWIYINEYPAGDGTLVDLLDTSYAHGIIRTGIKGTPNGATTGAMFTFYADTPGGNTGFYGTASIVPIHQWVHVAWRRYQEADLTWSIDHWINDTMMEKATHATAPAALNVSDTFWALGIHPAAGVAGYWATASTKPGCYVDDVRVSKIKRTDAEIIASYQAGIAGSKPSLPTISNFTPGTNLASNGTFSFDVTTTALLDTMIWVTLGGTTKELVWDGSAFVNGYTGSSRSAITNGYTYTLSRTGGWPAGTVTPSVKVIDTSGQEVAG